MSTISDVAKAAGVSKATVSRVLNNTAIVNSETRAHILQTIEQLHFVPNINARGMRNKSTGIIGVVFPEYLNPFGYEIIQHIELATAQKGYHTLITSIGPQEDKVSRIRELVNRSIDGLVLYLYDIEPEMHRYLFELSQKKQMPLVYLGDYSLRWPVNIVVTRSGMGIMVKHLLERGRRKIGIIAVRPTYMKDDRITGYQDALREAGIDYRNDYVFNADYSLESGYKAGEYFVSMGAERPDAIVSYTDYMAIGAMNYLQKSKILIPEDIAIAGYDGISMGRFTNPPLTTFKQDFKQYGLSIVESLLEQMADPERAPQTITLEGELIVRESTDDNYSWIISQIDFRG